MPWNRKLVVRFEEGHIKDIINLEMGREFLADNGWVNFFDDS